MEVVGRRGNCEMIMGGWVEMGGGGVAWRLGMERLGCIGMRGWISEGKKERATIVYSV